MGGFLNFMLSQDILGHEHSINYMGDVTFNTKLGALLSIIIKILVLYQLVEKSIELLAMSDPGI